MSIRKTVLPFAIAAVLTLSACSSKAESDGAPATSPRSTAPAAVVKTAAQITEGMTKPDGAKVTVWTAETDPNKKLGRPDGYTSAATICDPRVKTADSEPGASCGLTVEVWSSEADAKQRAEFIATAQKNGNGVLGTEYHTIHGGALLRVTGELTPDQAKVYAESFGKVAS
ncbi:hypothetical protein ACXJJ3_32625 [Kribbella sp. WER1]